MNDTDCLVPLILRNFLSVWLLARPSHGVDVSVCLFVCLFVCVYPRPPGAWTFRYLLYTLDLKVPLGPLGTSPTFRYLLDH